MARIVLIPVRRSTVDDDGDLAMLGLGGARDKQEVRRRSVAKGLELSGNPTAVGNEVRIGIKAADTLSLPGTGGTQYLFNIVGRRDPAKISTHQYNP